MNAKMNVVYLQSVGHVLAVVTRTAEPPNAGTDVSPFVGDGLHVRGLGVPPTSSPWTDFNAQDFVIPPNQLAVLPTDLDPTVLLAPRTSYVDSNHKVQSLNGSISNASYSAPKVAITLFANTAVPLDVLVLIEGQSLGAPLSLSGTISASTNSTNVSTPSLSLGSYYALVFVATFIPYVKPFTIS
jgi:hypothetical protein